MVLRGRSWWKAEEGEKEREGGGPFLEPGPKDGKSSNSCGSRASGSEIPRCLGTFLSLSLIQTRFLFRCALQPVLPGLTVRDNPLSKACRQVLTLDIY